MSNAVISTSALLDAAALSTTGTVSSTLPLSNLQTMEPGEVCRFTSLTGMMIVIDLESAAAINFLALIAHNLTADATWRIRGADSEANLTADPGYDPGAESAWPSTGKPIETDWPAFTSLHFISTAQTFRWWRIDITDVANPDDHVDIGRLYVDAAWQPTRNIKLGNALGWIDPSLIVPAVGGQKWSVERPRRRFFEFELDFLTEDEMLNNAFELDRRRGLTKDVLFVKDPAATTHLHRHTVYGTMTDLPPIVQRRARIFRKPFRIEELRP